MRKKEEEKERIEVSLNCRRIRLRLVSCCESGRREKEEELGLY